ncbi:MAG: ABC transporter substrate-binding protein [Pseudomonadota bacterium]
MIRSVLLALAFTTLLSGCERAPPEHPVAQEAARAAPAPPVTCSPGLRLFEHPRLVGDAVCIPEAPTRIVDLSVHAVELMQLSGDSVIGAKPWTTRILAKNFPYLRPDLEAITNIGDPGDLETIAALGPDLIFGTPHFIAGMEDQLRAIAPLLVYEASAVGVWQEGFEFVGAALNKEPLVAQLKQDYQDRIAALQSVLTERIEQPEAVEVSIARLWGSNSEMAMNLANSFSSILVAEAGLGRPASQGLSAEAARARYQTDGNVRISFERIDLIDGDILFLWSEAPDDDGDVAADARYLQLLDDPVWNSLGVVRNDAVVRAGGYWVGWGFHAAHAVIDDLLEHVAGVAPASVAPNPMVQFNQEDRTERRGDTAH